MFTLASTAFAQRGETRSGYFNNTKAGLMSVLTEEYGGGFISTVNGWHFSEKLSAGIGISVQGYRDAPVFYPISGHVAYFIQEKISSPYVYGSVGYSLTFEDLYKGSISPEIGLGWQFKVGGVSLGPEIGFRRERWRARTAEITKLPNETVVAYTGPYTSDFLNQINLSISVFF